jgi:uncharacterized OsmC-like protein
MSTAVAPTALRDRVPLNGVDTPQLLATINAVKANRPLAKFQFRATNRWQRGTHSRSRIEAFSGAGGEHKHTRAFEFDADHPPVLTGSDSGPTPTEILLVALSGCLTAGIGNIAAVRGIRLTSVEAHVEGDIDLSGILGLPEAGRNGYEQIRVHYRISGDASPKDLEAVVAQAQDRSAVLDVLTHGVPVSVSVAVE